VLQRSRASIPVVSRTCDDVNIQLDRFSTAFVFFGMRFDNALFYTQQAFACLFVASNRQSLLYSSALSLY
jgi:hypothetical protein